MQLEMAKQKSIQAFQQAQTHWKSRIRKPNVLGWLKKRSVLQLVLVPVVLVLAAARLPVLEVLPAILRTRRYAISGALAALPSTQQVLQDCSTRSTPGATAACWVYVLPPGPRMPNVARYC